MNIKLDSLIAQLPQITGEYNVANKINGWDFKTKSNPHYTKARLTYEGKANNEHGIILISAPGAVGKSIMAKEICAAKNYIYLDLSQSETIAGNYITGGIAKQGLYSKLEAGDCGIVIDALDEARLRVTQSSFEDFISDLASINPTSHKKTSPIIVFGRTGIIEETWLILKENHSIDCPVYDIEFFNENESCLFIKNNLNKLSINNASFKQLEKVLNDHGAAYESAIRTVVERLKIISANESSRFYGYAPVLDAVSIVIAGTNNPSTIHEKVNEILSNKNLDTICDNIINREQQKLTSQLVDIPLDAKSILYNKSEQLERLAHLIFKISDKSIDVEISNEHRPSYEAAVSSMLPQHPFLNSSGIKSSNYIFEACILSYALTCENNIIKKHAENYCLSTNTPPNPFLFDFYQSNISNKQLPTCNTEHIGIIFDSILAKQKSNDSAALHVEEDEENNISTSFVLYNSEQGEPEEIEFISEGCSKIRLGRKVSNLFIDVESCDVEFVQTEQLELTGPISIQCDQITLNSERLIVKNINRSTDTYDENVKTDVILCAKSSNVKSSMGIPIVGHDVELFVSWPQSEHYPWTNYSYSPSADEVSDTLALTLRVLRRIIMAFRSHSKGRLARLADKINHSRMLKNEYGEKLLATLIKDKIIRQSSHMYYLDPNKLGDIVGISFLDANRKKYSNKTIEYINKNIYE